MYQDGHKKTGKIHIAGAREDASYRFAINIRSPTHELNDRVVEIRPRQLHNKSEQGKRSKYAERPADKKNRNIHLYVKDFSERAGASRKAATNSRSPTHELSNCATGL